MRVRRYSDTYIVKPFDPWKSKLCTCPEKYSFNPYTGCSHKCLYCYSSSYIKDFFHSRIKRNVLGFFRRDLLKIPEGSLIELSSSTDPYQGLEEKFQVSRKSLETLLEMKRKKFRVLIVTKSNLVRRDIDLLREINVAVTITITTLDPKLSSKLEPGAPKPEKRITALRELKENSIPIAVRLDPVIPFLTDNPENLKEVVEAASSAGATQIISSTYKVKRDNFERMIKVFPELKDKWREAYFVEGVKIKNYHYLSIRLRRKLMVTVKAFADKYKVRFSSCREGFLGLQTAQSCNGSALTVRNVN